jgi:hypothetical protein
MLGFGPVLVLDELRRGQDGETLRFIVGVTMSFILQPWQLFFLVLSAWVNRYQQQTIDFYISQTKALLKCQGKKRILLNDDQRRMLAVKGESDQAI